MTLTTREGNLDVLDRVAGVGDYARRSQRCAGELVRVSHPDLESLYFDSLPDIEMILAVLARRHSLSPDAAARFAAWAKARIGASDYAVLANFRGQTSLKTYLAVTLANLYREYCVVDF